MSAQMNQFQWDLLQAASSFIRGLEGIRIPVSLSTPIGKKGRVLEESRAILNNIIEKNIVASVEGSRVCIKIGGIRVRLPEVTFLLSEERAPNLFTAGYVEVDVTHSELEIQFYFQMNDSLPSTELSNLLLVKTQAELKHWDGRISPNSPLEKTYFKNSSVSTGKIKPAIETATEKMFARLFLEKVHLQETIQGKAKENISSAILANVVHA